MFGDRWFPSRWFANRWWPPGAATAATTTLEVVTFDLTLLRTHSFDLQSAAQEWTATMQVGKTYATTLQIEPVESMNLYAAKVVSLSMEL